MVNIDFRDRLTICENKCHLKYHGQLPANLAYICVFYSTVTSYKRVFRVLLYLKGHEGN